MKRGDLVENLAVRLKREGIFFDKTRLAELIDDIMVDAFSRDVFEGDHRDFAVAVRK